VPAAVSSSARVRDVSHAGQPAAVTITVQITVPNGVLPVAARRLISDLRSLTGTTPEVDIGPQGPEDLPEESGARCVPGSVPGSVPGAAADPPLRLVGAQGSARGARYARDGQILYLDNRSRTVLRDGVPIHLSRREYDLLIYLCLHPRRVFGRAQLLRSVWGYEMIGGERTVDVHVRRLRAKLGRYAAGIVTVRGVGYRFDDQAGVSVVVEPG
jgi:two-component system, OmpR family, response regulator